jgi:hypothetical protein
LLLLLLLRLFRKHHDVVGGTDRRLQCKHGMVQDKGEGPRRRQ